MITACTHCGSKYELPDKMLGREARCKACGEMFMITQLEGAEPSAAKDDADVFVPPKRELLSSRRRAAQPTQTSDDPLDALASAGDDAGYAYTAQRSHAGNRDPYDGDRPARARKARGAAAAMSMGIASLVFVLAALVCGLITMLSGDHEGRIVIFGPIAIVLLVISIGLAMIAVMNGTSASSRIRKARHPIGGRSQASTGSITGGIALLLALGLVIAGSAWLINRGGIQFIEVRAVGEE